MNDTVLLYSVSDYEAKARQLLDTAVRTFLDGIADDGVTYKDNTEAFKRYKFRPQVLRNVSRRSMGTTMLGEAIDIPIGVSPFGLARIFHKDGEIGLAKACKKLNTCYIQSCASHYSIEEVAGGESDSLRWQQIYIYKDRDILIRLIRESEKHGVKALVLTVDAPVIKRKGVVNQFPAYMKFGNFQSANESSDDQRSSFHRTWAGLAKDPSFNWEDLRWLKQNTKLPIILKGILTGENAKKAVEYGADGIMVSNHGGRYLDGVQATIDALSEVVGAVNGAVEIYFDGGIRSGTDVLKALALGARAVFVGRPAAWALTVNGENGVYNMLTLLKEKLDIAMALTGVTTIQSIDKDIVVHQSKLSHL